MQYKTKPRTTLELKEFKKYMANSQGSLCNSKSKNKHSDYNDRTTFDKYLIINKNTKILILKFQIFIFISTVDLGLQKI